jgi:hypothetical protein
VARLLQAQPAGELRRCYGSANGDPLLDDWEDALLAADLGAGAAVLPPARLGFTFGQHGGLGALRVAAAALDVSRGIAPVLVHGIARGGCRIAILLDRR